MRFIKVRNNIINLNFVNSVSLEKNPDRIVIFYQDLCYHLDCKNNYCFEAFCCFMEHIHEKETNLRFGFCFDFDKHLEFEDKIENEIRQKMEELDEIEG